MSRRNYQLEREQARKDEQRELESVQKFHEFLMGNKPKGISTRRIRKMNADQAMTVIWFLQEACHLIDDRFEMCHACKTIYDSHAEGAYIEKTGHCYCDSCDPRPY